ncbi:MAG: hypothetical protein ACPGK3_04400 [Paracoccaceae bacterium]
MDIDPTSDGLAQNPKLPEVAIKAPPFGAGSALPIKRLAGCLELTDQIPVARVYRV